MGRYKSNINSCQVNKQLFYYTNNLTSYFNYKFSGLHENLVLKKSVAYDFNFCLNSKRVSFYNRNECQTLNHELIFGNEMFQKES